MRDLYVDLDAMAQLAGSLNGIHDSLLHATESFAAGASAACSTEVAGALASFGRGWHDGRRTITDEVHDLAQAAWGAGQAYQDAEAQIRADAVRGAITSRQAN
ncbi:MAG: hypothetical protein ACR2N4_07385 [Jatrophihabitans sp.]